MSPLSKSSWDTCDAKASADSNKQVHQYDGRFKTQHNKVHLSFDKYTVSDMLYPHASILIGF